MFSFLSALWFIRTTKAVLFWLYLWQLKEYHIGRFLDHFRTEKGKQLFLNINFGVKIVLIPLFFFLPLLVFFLLVLLYTAESVKVVFDILQRKLKKPVFTQKTALLILICLILEILLLFVLVEVRPRSILWFSFWLLVFDVLTPVFVSLIVLLLQPLAVFGRNQIIKKAKLKREQFKNLLVIGITGSYGKTSTKEFLSAILSQKFRVLATKEHQNSEIGIALCILNDLKPEHEIFIVEMGAYGRGGIKLLCDIAKPKIGILTGINEQHLATFGSLENIIKAKYELVEGLPADGTAFFNAKNKYCLNLYGQTKIKKFLYGENVAFAGLENIEGAKMVAKELGLADEEINRVLEKIENKFAGIKIKKSALQIDGYPISINVIDATYSANPDSVISHLEYLKGMPGRKILVMPCLIELGSASSRIHRRIGQKIAETCDLAIITTQDKFKEIKGEAGDKAMFMENPKEIFEKIKSFCKEGDIVLLESRVPNQLINLLIG